MQRSFAFGTYLLFLRYFIAEFYAHFSKIILKKVVFLKKNTINWLNRSKIESIFGQFIIEDIKNTFQIIITFNILL